MEQLFQQPLKNSESNREGIDKWESQSSSEAGTESNSTSGFDCNICLDLVQDPVVTFCGHLYCWPCIYRWMNSKSNEQLDCPVCKAQVSQNTLIPLYGRGQPRQPFGCKGPTELDIVPQRPSGPGPSCGVHRLIATASSGSDRSQHRVHPRDSDVHHYYSLDDYSQSGFGFAGTTTYNLMIDMLGEMIYARNVGNSQTTLYTYPNNYGAVTASSVRLRRHVMRVDRSLSRVTLFLCCCAVLCLLLF